MSVLNTLRERVLSYETLTDYKLIKKLPVVIKLNGRSFKKLTSLLPKPFHLGFSECMWGVALKLMQEIDGSIISYCFNDEIILISKNDQNINTSAWYDNHIQRIASTTASIATIEFAKLSQSNDLNLIGDATFISNCFVVPNITEAINLLISKQQEALYLAISLTCFHELSKKYDIETVKQTLYEKSSAAKLEILSETCGIDFEMLPAAFRRGVAAYRILKIMENDGLQQIRPRLIIDEDLPVFSKDQEFLHQILTSGKDIIRAR